MNKKYEMDMCNGPLLSKILIFTLPLMASGILQLLFNAADMVVAGRFAGSSALGAIGATSSFINLLVSVFIGLSVGANVTIAHFYGARHDQDVSDTVHTTIALAIVSGIVLMLLGFFVCGPTLKLMGTPAEILDYSTIYMKIYFIGVPAMLLYNFGAAILRAIGDTKRPLIYLSIAGVINVILNMIFVIVFGLGVVGVALATDISQIFSAAMVFITLTKAEGSIALSVKKIRFHKNKVMRIIRIGLPAGFQGAIFSVSNVLIQSSVNSFGAIAVAGNTACMSIEGFVYNGMNAFHQTAISFTGQNMGANNHKRVRKTLSLCLMCVTVTGLVLGCGFWGVGRTLLGVYTDNPEVVAFGMRRMVYILPTYFLCGIMDVAVGVIRGMGYSVMPMIVSLLGACAFRIIWIFTVFQIVNTPECLYVSYPISWILTFCVHMICYSRIIRKYH